MSEATPLRKALDVVAAAQRFRAAGYQGPSWDPGEQVDARKALDASLDAWEGTAVEVQPDAGLRRFLATSVPDSDEVGRLGTCRSDHGIDIADTPLHIVYDDCDHWKPRRR